MTLAIFFSWVDRFVATLVADPEDRFSRDEAQIILKYPPYLLYMYWMYDLEHDP